MQKELPEFNINELVDDDIVIYEDRDIEFKNNTHSVYTNGKMLPRGVLEDDIDMREFTHVLTVSSTKKYKLFIVKIDDEEYDIYSQKRIKNANSIQSI